GTDWCIFPAISATEKQGSATGGQNRAGSGMGNIPVSVPGRVVLAERHVRGRGVATARDLQVAVRALWEEQGGQEVAQPIVEEYWDVQLVEGEEEAEEEEEVEEAKEAKEEEVEEAEEEEVEEAEEAKEEEVDEAEEAEEEEAEEAEEAEEEEPREPGERGDQMLEGECQAEGNPPWEPWEPAEGAASQKAEEPAAAAVEAEFWLGEVLADASESWEAGACGPDDRAEAGEGRPRPQALAAPAGASASKAGRAQRWPLAVRQRVKALKNLQARYAQVEAQFCKDL
ncbi:hypothetical protein DBR06_SOUSAS58810003, partial [Sousa chinensis]